MCCRSSCRRSPRGGDARGETAARARSSGAAI
jgi:hypothetical protein